MKRRRNNWEGKKRVRKGGIRDSFTLSSEVEILKMCLSTHQIHTWSDRQGQLRSPFGECDMRPVSVGASLWLYNKDWRLQVCNCIEYTWNLGSLMCPVTAKSTALLLFVSNVLLEACNRTVGQAVPDTYCEIERFTSIDSSFFSSGAVCALKTPQSTDVTI